MTRSDLTATVRVGQTHFGETDAPVVRIHRPRSWSAGAGRRIRVELDGIVVAHVEHGASVEVRTSAGAHLLRARCLPLLGTEFRVNLSSQETLELSLAVSALGELVIRPTPAEDAAATTTARTPRRRGPTSARASRS